MTTEHGTKREKRDYTVVLVFPPDMWDADDQLSNTLVYTIKAEGVKEAVKRAQLTAADEEAVDTRPSEFMAAAVFEGYCKDQLRAS